MSEVGDAIAEYRAISVLPDTTTRRMIQGCGRDDTRSDDRGKSFLNPDRLVLGGGRGPCKGGGREFASWKPRHGARRGMPTGIPFDRSS